MELKRLNKAISETGYCSRRAADKLIENGSVKVNGKAVGLGVKVSPSDSICIHGQIITLDVEPIYLAFNKPIGITCTTDTKIRQNIISYINYPERIFPIGRLDKPSEGLIFMTNDGDIVNKILRSKNNHEKEYLVTVSKKITNSFIQKMASGVPVLDTVSDKCKVTKVNDFTFNITLTQGLNRQIRRMCMFLGYEVTKLKRIRIMNIELGNLKPGSYRNFTRKELDQINRSISGSSKTEEASKKRR
ncbi:MAG: 23S rRNA pseudouridine synthase F [Flavobacteriaceae bacterium]|nr:MAG: 23S rRNA pseudouridine synthase F [Flavobacteriaceae bacterium]